ncbi:DUF7286 family protein [Halopiger goleimassiliensis]|uniref:DUF7286 family protein n=1 Tax=Halopiger goleimassiliensis TaxID=1293048 RepID=UPI0006779F55|nr:hypothetical protein [Halopiger goleimassiliensis]
MSRRNRSRREGSITIGDRGHVPFAMIAVLLLVSSIGVVAVLEQRSEPTVDHDADRLLDRTEVAAQSELRSAVLEATHQAGAAPINTTDNSTVPAIVETDDQTEAFENYVKLLIYVEAVDRLPRAGQTAGPEARSSVSLQSVSNETESGALSPSRAIELVDLEVGYFDDGLEEGIVDVTLHGVEFDAEVGREDVPMETRSVSTQVGTPVFELNEKRQEYESELNRDFAEFDGLPDPTSLDGLGQELAGRLYPIAYMKATWNRFGEPTLTSDDQSFEEILGIDHTEVLANHAIFAVQEDVFGTRDPYADRTMRPQYLCMSLDLATTISDVDLGGEGGDVVPDGNNTFTDGLEEQAESVEGGEFDDEAGNASVPVDEDTDFQQELCEDDGLYNEWIFGDQATGELPEVPPMSELIQDGIESMDVADQEIEVPVTEFAQATYYEYQLSEATDPVAYLQEQADAIQGDVEDAGGTVEEDVDVDDFDHGGDSYNRDLADISDDLYELGVSIVTDSNAGTPPTPETPPGYEDDGELVAEVVDNVTIESVSHDPMPDGDEYTRPIHHLEANATVNVTTTHEFEAIDKNVTSPNTTIRSATGPIEVSVNSTIESEYGIDDGGRYFVRPDEFEVDTAPIATDYGSHENATFRPGFETALLALTTVDNYDDAADEIASSLESALESAEPSSLETAATSIGPSNAGTISADEVLPDDAKDDLLESLDDELEDVHEAFDDAWEEDPYHMKLSDAVDEDDSPPERVKEHIKDAIEPQLVDGGPYETPEEKAKQQVRRAYFDRLYYWLDLFGDEYSGYLGSVNDEIDNKTDGAIDGLNEVLDFVQGFANADFDPDPEQLRGSPVLDDAHYEVSGAPTYLSASAVDRNVSAAVRPANATVLDTDVPTDFQHDPLSIQTEQQFEWPGFEVAPFPNSWYATLNVWNVTVNGEYARLEVSSTVGDPADSDRLTYLAEERPVEVELPDGSTVQAGRNEAVDFETGSDVVVIVPGLIMPKGGPVAAAADSVADGDDEPICSPTWEAVGPDAPSDSAECLLE